MFEGLDRLPFQRSAHLSRLAREDEQAPSGEDGILISFATMGDPAPES